MVIDLMAAKKSTHSRDSALPSADSRVSRSVCWAGVAVTKSYSEQRPAPRVHPAQTRR